jgi:predicted aldo/keto reductase-like oxidoreductase
MSDSKMDRREFVRDAAVAAAGMAAGAANLGAAKPKETAAPARSTILSYNENMEYRRLGKTGLMVSAVCMGGHWKRLQAKGAGFQKNRTEVVARCMDVGINYIDACCDPEVRAYSKAIEGRRDKVYLGFSWISGEMRYKDFRTEAALLGSLEKGMKECGLDYVDLWRITMHEKSSNHTNGEVEEMMKALEKAKQQGKARFTGFSSHDRPHVKWMIETFPKSVDAICTPYTANSKVLPKDSLFDAVKACDVGVFGIKPFSSNSIFKGDGQDGNPDAEEDSKTARLAIRYILGNPAITAPIPGLISNAQVDNVAKAVKERRELDKDGLGQAEREWLEKVHREAWANLPADYCWLRDWEYV